MIDDFEKVVIEYLEEVNSLGYIKGGHNGPYYDQETPVRNSANWIIIFGYFYKKTKNDKYLRAIIKLADFLISEKARPDNKNFYCRTNPKKDYSNGIIGPAWAIQGLVEAYRVTKKEVYINVADEVFNLHKFDKNNCMWEVLNIDGSETNKFDNTLNHQIWFAAAGYEIYCENQNQMILNKLNLFFDLLKDKLKTYRNGLIKHPLYQSDSVKNKIITILKNIKITLLKIKDKNHYKYKENGYHLFNMYGLSIFYNLGYEHELFKTKKFKKAIKYCCSEDLIKSLEFNLDKKYLSNMHKVKNSKINIYGYPYNAPGFEAPFIFSVFQNYFKEWKKYLRLFEDKQLIYTFSSSDKRYNKNNEDYRTLESRFSEYIRYLNNIEG